MPEWTPSIGAVYDGRVTTFRVWSPDRTTVELAIEPDDVRALKRDEDGCWSGRFDDAGPGTLYRYRLDGCDDHRFPDPASRSQPHGVHGPSCVVDPGAFRWSDAAWQAPELSETIFYELHVGTFSPAGTYRGVIDRLPELAALGVTALELMPVGDFPGARNWGYDGVAIFAPARCYGTPDDLRALVDAAHRHQLALYLDVVYNHLGPDGAYANALSSHYFTDAHRSPWGRGVNLDGPRSDQVRRFFIENALHWVREYHIDGLRLDATHELHDSSEVHFLAELTTTVRTHAGRPVRFVAEDDRNLARMLHPVDRGGYGIDAAWADDFHHQARVHTARDREGYYQDYRGTTADIADTIRQGWFFTGQHSRHLGEPRGSDPSSLAPWQFVICTQNHDQVGNRADGARLGQHVDLATYRALTTLLLLAPQTPLLFMGQEWGATTPFLFFTDHHDELGRLVTAGRRQEFGAFEAFADEARRQQIADPQDGETFRRSRLHWDERSRPDHADVLKLHQKALALRRQSAAWRQITRESYEVRALDVHTVSVSIRSRVEADAGGEMFIIVCRLSHGDGPAVETGAEPRADLSGEVVFTTEDEDVCHDPQPIAVSASEVVFLRPGAVVLRRRDV